jgi:predicted lipoprotein with Yx(FWY)xxD motif
MLGGVRERMAAASGEREADGRRWGRGIEAGTTPRSDGRPEVTYNGHPLYTYTGDSKPGDVNGQGLTAFGAAWFALSPSGSASGGR